MSADVVGYSRLMADDEIGTIRALTTCRDKIMEFVDMGLTELKNIPEPIRAYQLLTPKLHQRDLQERSDPTTLHEILPLPAKPSLAVLPFVILDMDQEQDHFSDGLT